MRFAYRLALALGWFDVDAMLATGAPGQLHRWELYHELEPFGEPWKQMSSAVTNIINTVNAIAMGMQGEEVTSEQVKAAMMALDALVPKPLPVPVESMAEDDDSDVTVGAEDADPLEEANQQIRQKVLSCFGVKFGS